MIWDEDGNKAEELPHLYTSPECDHDASETEFETKSVLIFGTTKPSTAPVGYFFIFQGSEELEDS